MLITMGTKLSLFVILYKHCQHGIAKILKGKPLESLPNKTTWCCFKCKKKQTLSTWRKLWEERARALISLRLIYSCCLPSCYDSCLLPKEENIEELLLLLILGICNPYLVMLIRNLIFMYLSQRKYHFIKIQFDSDSICEDDSRCCLNTGSFVLFSLLK